MRLDEYLKKRKKIVDEALDSYLPGADEYPEVIHRAMRYACFPGGKRFRPILTLTAARLVGGKEKDVLPAACGVELIHNYSLIHDDLPALDNDDRRRGKPSCHRKFGEAVALLAGDALLTLSFQLLSTELRKNFRPKVCVDVLAELSGAAGTAGMIGGQVVDLSSSAPDLAVLEYIHTRKTGRLIKAAVKTGALLGGAGAGRLKSLEIFGEKLGFMFQLVDDILDKDGVVRLLGMEKSRRWANRLTEEAKEEIGKFGRKAKILKQITDAVSNRRK